MPLEFTGGMTSTVRCSALLLAFASSLQLEACGRAFTTAEPGGTAGRATAADSAGRGGTTGGANEIGGADEPAGGPDHAGEAGASTNESGGSSQDGGGSTSIGYREVILADGPLAYWRMGRLEDSSIPDETGRGNDLVLQGEGHVLHSAGAVLDDPQGALGFDGERSFAIASDARAFDFVDGTAFTLECWARRANGGASYFQYLVANVQGVANDRDGYSLYLLPEPQGQDSAVSAFEYDLPAKDLGIRGPLPTEGSWAHYASVFDGSKIFLFVNGTLASSAKATGSIGPRTSQFAIGRHSDNNGFYFKGAIDEVAVYQLALGVADIARHISAAKRGGG